MQGRHKLFSRRGNRATMTPASVLERYVAFRVAHAAKMEAGVDFSTFHTSIDLSLPNIPPTRRRTLHAVRTGEPLSILQLERRFTLLNLAFACAHRFIALLNGMILEHVRNEQWHGRSNAFHTSIDLSLPNIPPTRRRTLHAVRTGEPLSILQLERVPHLNRLITTKHSTNTPSHTARSANRRTAFHLAARAPLHTAQLGVCVCASVYRFVERNDIRTRTE